jgi:dTDP-4-amino-4,6-dideoxygalactose transaminase
VGATGVAEYERQFAERTASPFAVAFTYARTALAAILEAAGLVPDDEVVLSPLTCKVVPLAILGAGLRPRYADIRPGSLNLSVAALAGATGERTRAVLFQRTYGNASGVAETAGFAREHGLLFVEDSAQCMPTPAAWCGDAAIFSNNPGKPLSAGSGGVAVIRDGGLAERVTAARAALPVAPRRAALQSRAEAWIRNRLLGPALYWPAFRLNRRLAATYRPRPLAIELADEFKGVAARINGTHARAGLAALAQADAIARHRIACCDHYGRALDDVRALELPVRSGEPLYWFPVLVPRKDELLRKAQRRRVEIVPWPVRMPIYPLTDPAALANYGYQTGSCPVAEDVARRLVGLPTHPLVRERHRNAVIALLTEHGDEAS